MLRPLFIGLDCILDLRVRICLRIWTAHRSWTDGRLARQRRNFGIEGRVGVDECNRLKAKPRVLGDVYLSLHKGMEYIVYMCVYHQSKYHYIVRIYSRRWPNFYDKTSDGLHRPCSFALSLSLSLSLTFCLSVLSFLLSLQPNLDAYIGRTVESLVNGPTLSHPRENLVRSRTSWLRIRSILGLLLLQDLKHVHPWLPVAPTSSRASKATFSQECSMTPHM